MILVSNHYHVKASRFIGRVFDARFHQIPQLLLAEVVESVLQVNYSILRDKFGTTFADNASA